ncbi:alpha/beta hydrolase [Oculatella sp. LEGE 06141]|uniref:alpha/beta fold hydrolase n=1 Tax=Oculatella sp. LEGE 06141 TaxID=1828648 RepID=UPI0018814A16|nr:alpha/beta hydrolase [Oculatella sp. LEGE 06141]MBE9177720.1 alpha/beta hydrolase [Oculatella sp. LEGE 06141]
MPYITIRGVDHYYEWVSTSAPSSLDEKPQSGKPVMVFLHGWAGSARYWHKTALALAEQFDCLLYDLRGFGRSRFTRPISSDVTAIGYELESYADDLAALLDAFQLLRVYLNAHSTGSSIATLFLNRYPEQVEQAILTCSGIFEYDEKAFTAFHKFGGYVVKFRPRWLSYLPFVNRLFMARFLRRSLPDAVSREFMEDFLMAEYEAALGTIYTSVSQRAAEEMPQEFARLTVPTLLVSGEYDQIIPAEMGRQAAALNQNIDHVVMSNTGHFPMLEDEATYLQHVRTFLKLDNAPTPANR